MRLTVSAVSGAASTPRLELPAPLCLGKGEVGEKSWPLHCKDPIKKISPSSLAGLEN